MLYQWQQPTLSFLLKVVLPNSSLLSNCEHTGRVQRDNHSLITGEQNQLYYSQLQMHNSCMHLQLVNCMNTYIAIDISYILRSCNICKNCKVHACQLYVAKLCCSQLHNDPACHCIVLVSSAVVHSIHASFQLQLFGSVYNYIQGLCVFNLLTATIYGESFNGKCCAVTYS